MIKSFKIYESVNINFFYLVLRNQPNTFENLAKLKLDGLKGISDNYNIARHWFDVRDIILIMNSDDVFKLNTELIKIEYDNFDLLLKNNLDLFIRIGHDDKGKRIRNGYDYAIQNAIQCILQDINREEHKLNNKLYDICEFLSAPEVYYKISNYFKNKEVNINNLNDLTDYIIQAIKELPNIGNDYPWSKLSWDEKQENTINATKKEFEKILKIGISYRCDAHKTEGEWYNYSDRFIIPKKSILFFKEDVGKYINYGTHGMKSEKINSIIDEYSLKKYYNISKVANHDDMTEILIKDYLNEN
jgi:hypothetical protein